MRPGPLGSNALAGHTWGQMSSLGFKQKKEEQVVLDHDKDGKPIPLYNPLTGKHDIKFTRQEPSTARRPW